MRDRARAAMGGVIVLVGFAVLALGATGAQAASSRPLLETFPPSFGAPEGLAVDQGSHDLLVIDAAAKTVSRWHSNGSPSDFAALGTNVIDGKGTGNCATVPADCDQTPQNGLSFGESREVEVAIDESGGATDGDIYVVQQASKVVDVFAPNGGYLGQITAYVNTNQETVSLAHPCGVAVDPAGTVYVAENGSGSTFFGVHQYVPSANPPLNIVSAKNLNNAIGPCTVAAGAASTASFVFYAKFDRSLVGELDVNSGQVVCRLSSTSLAPKGAPKPIPTTVTTNPVNGHLFVVRGFVGLAKSEVAEYDGSCPPDNENEDGEVLSLVSLPTPGEGGAVDAAGDRVYVSRKESTHVEVYGPPIPLPGLVTQAAAPVGETSATLNGTVNPNGQAVEECGFEYLTEGKAEKNEEEEKAPYAGATTVPCAESGGEIGTGASPVHVHADVSGLEAGVQYRYRLRAKNVSGESKGNDQKAATRVPPSIEDEWLADATYTGATVKAKIRPHFYATAFRIEYGPGESLTQRTAPIAVGKDDTVHTLSGTLSGLQPGSTYRWRVVAEHENGETAEGAGGVLRTYREPGGDGCANAAFRAGPAVGLPDCRAYEMVSPLDKNGGDIVAAETPALGTSGFFEAAEGGGGITYTSASAFGDARKGAFANQYLARRGANGWSSHALNPPQGTTVFDPAGADMDLQTALDTGTGIQAFTPDLCQTLMVDWNLTPLDPGAIHGYTNLYWRENCGAAADTYEALTRASEAPPPPLDSALNANLALDGRNYSADRGEVVFNARAALTADAALTKAADTQVYARDAGGLHLVSVLPAGQGTSLRNNVVGSGFATHLGSLATAVSADGSRVFWTANADPGFADPSGSVYLRLDPTAPQAKTYPIFEEAGGVRGRFLAAGADGSKALIAAGPLDDADLYEVDVDRAIAEGAAAARTLVAHEAGGLVGASRDLARFYFTSKEALAAGATAGEWNLYQDHEGAIGFIATILPVDRDAATSGIDSLDPQLHHVRVSSDGRGLTFISSAPLTGYDNTDVASGEAAAEVYRFDAGSEQLACVSCNPSGARPVGQVQSGLRTAAWIPGWEWSVYGTRALSGDGNRLFFNSFDALVPTDVNDAQDVYEWEAVGTSGPQGGGCHAGDADYFAQNGGCVSLVSTGHGGDSSEFVDASADGEDAFISTNSSIDPRDPGLIDIYDAREGGGFPPPPPSPPPCVGDACQSIPAAPGLQTPNSASFEGPENPGKRKQARRCGKGRHRVNKGGKARCVRIHKRHPRRANHNRRAGR